MVRKIEILRPTTLKFIDSENTGFKRILIKTESGKIYYDRPFTDSQERASVNIPDLGKYTVETDNFVKMRALPLEKSKKKINLPEPEKDLKKTLKPYKVIKNNEIGLTPACISTNHGIIYYNDRFLNLPIYAQKFIMFHELGHRFYKTESFCDMYATKQMLKNGYNESSCVKSLKDILKSNPQSVQRIESVLGVLTN